MLIKGAKDPPEGVGKSVGFTQGLCYAGRSQIVPRSRSEATSR